MMEAGKRKIEGIENKSVLLPPMEKHLQSILRQPDTVLFVGSGVSTWSGLPSWPNLMEELAEFLTSKGHDPILVKKEAGRGDLLQAASYGFDKLTPPQIGEFIRQTCRIGKARPHEMHHKLVTLGPRCFVTTNYDRLLEASFQKWQPDRYYRTVINQQLIETAEIAGARSTREYCDRYFCSRAIASSVTNCRRTFSRKLIQGASASRYTSRDTIHCILKWLIGKYGDASQ